MFFGDSLTDAPNVEFHDRYPSVAQRILAEKGLAFQAIHQGVGGNTTADGLARIDEALDHHKPDILFLCLGGNDFLRAAQNSYSFWGYSQHLDTAKNNVVGMIRKAKERGTKVLLVGLQAPKGGFRMTLDFFRNVASDFSASFRNIAHHEQVPLLESLLEPIPSAGLSGLGSGHIFDPRFMNEGDRIHPNKLGHEMIGKHVAAFLEQHSGL